jgi:hypothetical protein
MRKMGLQAIYQAPRTSEPHPEHKIYPYLLKNLAISKADQVPAWSPDHAAFGNRMIRLLTDHGAPTSLMVRLVPDGPGCI